MNLNIKKLHPDAIVPAYASDGAACFDIVAMAPSYHEENAKRGGWISSFLPGGTASTFRTGLAFEIPPGWVMKIYSRSGHGFKNDVRLANCIGVIDSDYRGELLVRITNDGSRPFEVFKGDRIAQAMLERAERMLFTVVDELSETTRGAGGFGSTGTGAL